MGLKAAFEGQGLNAKPTFDDDGNFVGGHNGCFSAQHYDHADEDENDEWGQMKPVLEQKYHVDGREYTVCWWWVACAFVLLMGMCTGYRRILSVRCEQD